MAGVQFCATDEEYEKKLRDVLELVKTPDPKCIDAMLPVEFEACSAKEQWAEFSFVVPQNAANVYGIIMGGAVAAIFDTCIASACDCIYTGDDGHCVTLNNRISYMKGIKVGETAVIRVQILHAGKRTTSAKADMLLGDKVCYTAMGSVVRY